MAKQILIVEDDLFLKELIFKKFNQSDFDILHAGNADEAFAILKENKVDLILLDLLLPGMSGFEILSKLRSEVDYTDLPILVFSNLGEERDIKQAMDAGATDFLMKANYTLDDVETKIKSLLKI